MLSAEMAAEIPENAPRRISILGSTGSIGRSTLEVIASQPQGYEIEVLSAQNNVALLIEQARRFRPRLTVIGNEAHYPQLKAALEGSGIHTAAGAQALCEAAARPADWVMAAIVGVAGLKPTLAAMQTGATIAFASKECLVCAGELMLAACRRAGGVLLPVDSEHNALFQVFDFERPERIEKLVLTASGGPFRRHTAAQLAQVTPEQAVAHPNWDMGEKISVDSATMMNKALEIIEAYHLFPVEAGQIEAVIHPESVIHSLVQYRDGSVLAQLGMPDMRIPIAYTLGWPDRLVIDTPRLTLAEIGALHFDSPDETRFPALRLAREALAAGQSACITLNAANEIAVEAFLAGRLPFTAITDTVERMLEQTAHTPVTSIEEALFIDEDIRLRCRLSLDINT